MKKIKETLEFIGALLLGGSVFILTLLAMIMLMPWFWLAVIAYILGAKL